MGVAAASAARHLPLLPGAGLRAQLAGAWLLEHPTVHVVPPALAASYPLAAGKGPEAPPEGNVWL